VAPLDPLTKPEHLAAPPRWLPAHAAAVAALVLGVAAFVVVAASQERLWATPDWRVSVPGFAVTGAAALVSIARRERGGAALWLVGLGLAASAIVLGWVLLLAIVVCATALLVLLLHSVL
jgi:hypothetical protein